MMISFQIKACETSIYQMNQKGWFDITVIQGILSLTGGVPERKDMEALRLLHCVHFMDMPQSLRMQLPGMMKKVMESPSMEINITFAPLTRPVQLLNTGSSQ